MADREWVLPALLAAIAKARAGDCPCLPCQGIRMAASGLEAGKDGA